jgi:hypothetical protein
MWSRRRVLAVSLLIAAFLLANYVIVKVLAPSGDDRGASPSAHPSISADECDRALRQLGNDVLDAIATPEHDVSAAPTPAESIDSSTALSAPECRRLLDAITSPVPAASVR